MRKENAAQLVELDGSTLEGGGQLIRNAVCLSALTGTPVQIYNIRGNRSSGGGLRAQHLACVKWLAHACSAKTEGAELKSKTLTFEPGKAKENAQFIEHSPAFKKVMRKGEPVYECRLDIGTAGSTGLALQAILPFILFSKLPSDIPVHLTLTGGTNQAGAPSYDYIAQVLLPTLRSIGFPAIEATLERRAQDQSTLGSLTLVIPSRRGGIALPAFRLSKAIKTNDDKSVPSHLRATFIGPHDCHKIFRDALLAAIGVHFGAAFSVESGNVEVFCEGNGHGKRLDAILVATVPVDATSSHILGKEWSYDQKIQSYERAIKKMATGITCSLAAQIATGAAVDKQMRDQLVIFEALARGTSEVHGGEDDDGEPIEPTLHTRTAEWVAKKMLKATFDAEGKCEGAAFGSENGVTDRADEITKLQETMENASIG